MINKFEKILVKKNILLGNIKKKVSKNNLIIEFEDDNNINTEILDFFNSHMKKSKKGSSIIMISSIYSVVAQDPEVYKNTNLVDNQVLYHNYLE